MNFCGFVILGIYSFVLAESTSELHKNPAIKLLKITHKTQLLQKYGEYMSIWNYFNDR
jgi:hypothetical protein